MLLSHLLEALPMTDVLVLLDDKYVDEDSSGEEDDEDDEDDDESMDDEDDEEDTDSTGPDNSDDEVRRAGFWCWPRAQARCVTPPVTHWRPVPPCACSMLLRAMRRPQDDEEDEDEDESDEDESESQEESDMFSDSSDISGLE